MIKITRAIFSGIVKTRITNTFYCSRAQMVPVNCGSSKISTVCPFYDIEQTKNKKNPE
jgi:hypothetical protein